MYSVYGGKMKKKFSLLVLFFCIFLTAEIKVDAATSCGKRYFPSAGTYVDYYLDNGYCYPSGSIMASARGILVSNHWNTIPVSVSCSYKTCKYKYMCGSNSCVSAVLQSCYEATATTKSETLKLNWDWNSNDPSQKDCINAWYDSPPMYATNFKETTKETCLRQRAGNKVATSYSRGFKYATDSYGYEVVNESYCTGSGTGGSSSSSKKYYISYYGNGATSQTYKSNGKWAVNYANPSINTTKMIFKSGKTYYSGYTYNILVNRYKRTGYNFGGWCTKQINSTSKPSTNCKNAGGKYFSGSSETFNYNTFKSSSVNLYAIWQPQHYKIDYDGNGATSQKYYDESTKKWASNYAEGTTLKNNNSVFSSGYTFLYGNKYNPIYNRFLKTGYTYAGWCTKKIAPGTKTEDSCKSNGTYTKYTNNKTATFKNLATSGTVKLYALWEANAYAINYNSNIPTNVNGKLTVKQNYCSDKDTYIDSGDDCSKDDYKTGTGNQWTHGSKVSKESNNLRFLHKTSYKYGKEVTLKKNRFKIIVTENNVATTSNDQEVPVAPLVSNSNKDNIKQVENSTTDKELKFLGWCTKSINSVDTKTTTASASCSAANGKFYENAAKVSNLSSGKSNEVTEVDLYAVWENLPVAYSAGEGEETTKDIDDEIVKVDTDDSSNVQEDGETEEFETVEEEKDIDQEETNEEFVENPKTGSVLIFFVWIIGLSALGYSLYYFKNKEKFEV